MKILIDLPADERRESGETYDNDIPLKLIFLERDPLGVVLTDEQRAS